MQFEYEGYCINILDTPGHQDFSEDTYHTLMAADSAVMVIDAAKGIEPQTRDPFDLIDELEREFGIGTYPMNRPVGCGVSFKGVYDRVNRRVLSYADAHKGRDRLAFMRIVSSKFERGNEYFHVQEGKMVKFSQSQQMMEREEISVGRGVRLENVCFARVIATKRGVFRTLPVYWESSVGIATLG